MNSKVLGLVPVLGVCSLLLACGPQPNAVNTTNTGNANLTNTVTNTNTVSNTNSAAATAVGAREPESYQATVTMRFETVGQNASAMPPLTAKVARSGDNRRMEFTMPAGGRVVFLDRGGKNYLVLPERRQYAELDKESMGFEVRRMLTPEQIVAQVKSVSGVERVGEEQFNGRDVVKYRYAAAANTQTQAGQVATESFLIVDKATGLPLRSETTSQSASGANVQGVRGVKVVTEMSDITTDAPSTLFDEPTNLEKIQSDQVRAQVDMLFNAVVGFLGQAIKSVQSLATPAP